MRYGIGETTTNHNRILQITNSPMYTTRHKIHQVRGSSSTRNITTLWWIKSKPQRPLNLVNARPIDMTTRGVESAKPPQTITAYCKLQIHQCVPPITIIHEELRYPSERTHVSSSIISNYVAIQATNTNTFTQVIPDITHMYHNRKIRISRIRCITPR